MEYIQVHNFYDVLRSSLELADTVTQIASRGKAGPRAYGQDDFRGILQSTKDIHSDDVSHDITVNSPLPSLSGPSCTCRAYSRMDEKAPLSFLHFRRTFRRRHYACCPKAKNSEETLEYTMKIVPPTWLLCHTIHLGLTIRNWSTTNGFSMSPVVFGHSRVVVAELSPAFEAIRKCYILINQQNHAYRFGQQVIVDSPEVVKSLHLTLRDMFESGTASVLDEDVYGDTLLSMCVQSSWSFVSCTDIARMSFDLILAMKA